MVDSTNSWWIDLGANDYICNSLQGFRVTRSVRPEKFQFLEKWKNCNFNYKLLFRLKIRNLFSGSWMTKQISPLESSRKI